MPGNERYVVVEVRRRGLLAWWLSLAWRPAGLLILRMRLGAARLAAVLAAPAEQLHLAIDVDDNLGGVALDAVLFPFTGA
ncbi:hypothetical protein D3C76_760660 [compost metagenome]